MNIIIVGAANDESFCIVEFGPFPLGVDILEVREALDDGVDIEIVGSFHIGIFIYRIV